MQKNTEFAQITVIVGNNPFEKRNAKAAFVDNCEKLFPNSTHEFFDGTGETNFGEFVQKIISPSMFGDTKILYFNHAESKNVLAKKEHFETFEKAIKICVDNVFVFVEIDTETSEKSSKNVYSPVELMEKIKPLTKSLGGSFTEFWTMKEYEIPKWIMSKVRENYGRYISEQNAELLVKLSGADLGILDGELQKIDAALSDKKEIAENDIYELTGNNRQISAQEIAQFLGQRKWNNESLAAFDEMSSKDNSFAVPFLSEIYRKFWTLLKIRLFAEEHRDKANAYFKNSDYKAKNQVAVEIAVSCGIIKESQSRSVFPIIIKPKLIEQASLFSKIELFEIIKLIAQHDRDIKNGVIKLDSHRESIKELCRQIVRIGK